MALVRGSGVDGIAAMRPRRAIGPGVDVVRPLLWAAKSSLAQYATRLDLPVSHDETNEDARYRRNAVRRMLADLEALVPGARRAIARSAAIAVDDKALLDAVAASAWSRVRTSDGTALVAVELRRLPDPLVRRVLRIEARRVAGTRDFTFAHCAAIAQAIRTRRGGRYHAGAAHAALSAGRVTFVRGGEPASARATIVDEIRVRAPRTRATFRWREGEIIMRRGRRTRSGRGDTVLALDAVSLPAGDALVVRPPRAGDRFVPSGRRRSVSLARFLAKAGLTREERGNVPLLCKGGAIVAVIGVRSSARFASSTGDRVIEVRWVPESAPTARRTSR